MLAMDIPMSAMCGMILAEAGAKLIESQDQDKLRFLRVTVLLFAAVAMAPNVFYYMLGWPAWETNFMWSWVDNIHDTPLYAASSHALFAVTLIPALIGFEIARKMILKGQHKPVRISYIVLLLLVGLIDLVLYDITFNVAPTYAAYQAGDTHSFWRTDFAIGWAITSVYFWVVLIAVYRWLYKMR